MNIKQLEFAFLTKGKGGKKAAASAAVGQLELVGLK
jgi:hypothetical protein